MGKVRRGWMARYRRDYEGFARLRGFEAPINSWPYVRRSFFECWLEPGFHRFWQVWNPGIAYFAFKVYVWLGGNRRRSTATMGAFLANGLVHTIVTVPFVGRWPWMMVGTFISFGLLTLVSRGAGPLLRQTAWPPLLNAAANVGLVILSFDVGFAVDRALM
jgi:hypothetical protein